MLMNCSIKCLNTLAAQLLIQPDRLQRLNYRHLHDRRRRRLRQGPPPARRTYHPALKRLDQRIAVVSYTLLADVTSLVVYISLASIVGILLARSR